jgi:ubiquinone/menaquinone biosynthesis C-methylase UbiE
MDPRLQKRVQRYGWDKAASAYEDGWREQLAPAQDLLMKMAALTPGERVLDTACGTGLVTLPAAAAVAPDGHVVGADISQAMVELAAGIAADRGVGNVNYARMELEAIDYDAENVAREAFDVALCSLGLMYAPDPVAALTEMHGALKPGGRMVASVWGKRANCGWADIFPIVDSRVQSEVCPMFFALGTGEALDYAFGQAGYKDISTERINVVLHYENDEQALGAAFVGGPVAMAYSRFDPETREAAHSEYLTSIAPFRKGDGYEIPGEFVVTRGVK